MGKLLSCENARAFREKPECFPNGLPSKSGGRMVARRVSTAKGLMWFIFWNTFTNVWPWTVFT